MSEQLPSRMSVELSLAGAEPVEVYDRAIGPVRVLEPEQVDALHRWEALPLPVRAMLTDVCLDRLDDTTLGALADWLEEHGQTAEGQRVRLLRPQPGDVVLVVMQAHGRSTLPVLRLAREAAARLAEATGLAAVVVHPATTLRQIDPGQLRAAGWVREEECAERVRAEREACAVTAEPYSNAPPNPDGRRARLAAAIRARGG